MAGVKVKDLCVCVCVHVTVCVCVWGGLCVGEYMCVCSLVPRLPPPRSILYVRFLCEN